MIEITVVIVSYNVKPFLEQALQSIITSLKGISSEIFVVDNGSGDGSAQMVRKRYPSVRLIENRENLGFARANNQALKQARGEMVCLVNPDTLVQEDTMAVCLSYLKEHDDTGAVGCKILNPDGSLQLSCRRSFPTPWVAFTKVTGLSRLFPKSKAFGRYNLTYLDPDAVTEVEALSGSFMMVRKKAVDQVGLLDEQFFLYGEDLDWCYRIHQNGWKIVYTPQTRIIHYKGQSTKEATFDSIRVFYSAMRLFVKKHFKGGWSFLPQWFLILGIWLRGAVSVISRLCRRAAVPAVDLVFLQIGLVMALLLRFGDLRFWDDYLPVNMVYTAVWLLSLSAARLYRRGVYSSSKAFMAVMLGLVLNTSITFFFPQYAFSRKVVIYAGLLNGLLLSGWRLVIRLASRARRFPFLGRVGQTLIRKRVLIVGTGDQAVRLYQRLKDGMDTDYEAVGMIGADERDIKMAAGSGSAVVGTLKELDRIARTHSIQSVIFSPEAARYDLILKTIINSRGLHLDFKMVPRDLDVIIGHSSVDTLEDVPLVDIEYRLYSGLNPVWKRLGDLLVGVLMLPAALAGMLFLALHSAHRVCLTQIGNGFGKSVRIPAVQIDGRGLFHGIGLFPLFLSLLTGRLSVVGSDIGLTGNVAGFKPGLTGLAQINKKKIHSDEDSQRYNLYYLRNYSLMLDMEILFRTVFHV